MTLVPAGILPTLEETRDAIIDAFDGKSPQVGDLVVGDLFNYKIFSRSDANGESITNLSLQRIHLEIDGKLVMAVQVGPSRLI